MGDVIQIHRKPPPKFDPVVMFLTAVRPYFNPNEKRLTDFRLENRLNQALLRGYSYINYIDLRVRDKETLEEAGFEVEVFDTYYKIRLPKE